MPHPLLLAATRVDTFDGQRRLTSASGFFFARDARLYLVTSRHVLIDEPSGHFPDRIELELHTDPADLTRSSQLSVPLYADGRSAWHQATDSGGEIDVAVLELDRAALPPAAIFQAFTPAHLQETLGDVELGSAVLVVGFPLGFHDTLHHLPVVRQAIIASAFGIRFQGRGCFVVDARMHRGTSGAPVVQRRPPGGIEHGPLAFTLLGVHSARFDMGGRDAGQDDALGLNCAWYADVLMTLTQAPARADGGTV